MAITGKWRRFNRSTVEGLSEKEGAYELGNATKSVIYIGSSKNLRRRLMTHLSSGKWTTTRYFRCDVVHFADWDTGTDKEARHAEKFQATRGRKPKYSKRSPRREPYFGF
jgi:DNA polymerase-3 subunit epsilon